MSVKQSILGRLQTNYGVMAEVYFRECLSLRPRLAVSLSLNLFSCIVACFLSIVLVQLRAFSAL